MGSSLKRQLDLHFGFKLGQIGIDILRLDCRWSKSVGRVHDKS